MTVSYTLQVATCTGVGNFWKLLFRWRGSIWKLMWPNLLAFMILVAVVSFVHRLCLNDEQEKNFQKIARKCKRDIDMIPMAFILGFYVNLVITRWWDQYCNMPWPDGMAVYISALIYGQDDRGRLIRRTLIRYCNLTLVLVMRQFSTRMQRQD